MTTLTDLKRLARAATPGPWTLEPSDPQQPSRYVRTCGYDPKAMESPTSIRCLNDGDSSYIAALSPERVLLLLELIDAADAMRERCRYEGAGQLFNAAKPYDALRAKLEKL